MTDNNQWNTKHYYDLISLAALVSLVNLFLPSLVPSTLGSSIYLLIINTNHT
jgi:hypothetical protein